MKGVFKNVLVREVNQRVIAVEHRICEDADQKVVAVTWSYSASGGTILTKFYYKDERTTLSGGMRDLQEKMMKLSLVPHLTWSSTLKHGKGHHPNGLLFKRNSKGDKMRLNKHLKKKCAGGRRQFTDADRSPSPTPIGQSHRDDDL